MGTQYQFEAASYVGPQLATYIEVYRTNAFRSVYPEVNADIWMPVHNDIMRRLQQEHARATGTKKPTPLPLDAFNFSVADLRAAMNVLVKNGLAYTLNRTSEPKYRIRNKGLELGKNFDAAPLKAINLLLMEQNGEIYPEKVKRFVSLFPFAQESDSPLETLADTFTWHLDQHRSKLLKKVFKDNAPFIPAGCLNMLQRLATRPKNAAQQSTMLTANPSLREADLDILRKYGLVTPHELTLTKKGTGLHRMYHQQAPHTAMVILGVNNELRDAILGQLFPSCIPQR